MSSLPPAIFVEALEKTYHDGWIRSRKIRALRGVSFEVASGTIFGLLGPNGAGKTTLIKVLLGIVRKSAGDARLLGFPAGDLRGRRHVGYLPETHRIPRHHTANSALEYYGSLSGLSVAEVRRRRPALLETVGLKDWGKTSVTRYSKGMQQRLGLAQALLHDPQLLILDEPTDGVDPVGRSEMRQVLQRLKGEGKTIFINSHLLQEVELVCDRVAIMDKGEVRRSGLIDEITRGHQADYEFLVLGPEPLVRTTLGGLSVTETSTLSGGQTRLIVRAADQAAVDSAVDRLRSAGISIQQFAPRRETLENAFLDIVRTK